MEESTSHFTSWSKSVLVLSTVLLLVKGGRSEELVLPTLQSLSKRRREREELVCGTVRTPKDRQTDRQDSPTQAGLTWTNVAGEERVLCSGVEQHGLQIAVEESVCFEPHLEVDSEAETEGVQETGGYASNMSKMDEAVVQVQHHAYNTQKDCK